MIERASEPGFYLALVRERVRAGADPFSEALSVFFRFGLGTAGYFLGR